MAYLFNKQKKTKLDLEDLIVIYNSKTGKILNAEVKTILSQVIDLDKLGQSCIEYNTSTLIDCETGIENQLPLQIADVLLKFEEILCDINSNNADCEDIIDVVFNENTGQPNEWIVQDNNTPVNLADTNHYQSGNTSINFLNFNDLPDNDINGNPFNSANYNLINFRTPTPFIVNENHYIEFYIKFNEEASIAFSIYFGLQGTEVANDISVQYSISSLNNVFNLNIDTTNTSDWQLIRVNISILLNAINNFGKLEVFQLKFGGGGQPNLNVDNIRIIEDRNCFLMQADFNEKDHNSPNFIKNKDNIYYIPYQKLIIHQSEANGSAGTSSLTAGDFGRGALNNDVFLNFGIYVSGDPMELSSWDQDTADYSDANDI